MVAGGPASSWWRGIIIAAMVLCWSRIAVST
jgi:hypothetical protein